MQKNVKRGFTLIELLVVIAIIAILAAILFPVFARARENARRTSCMSNLKQIALGVFMYNQDYDEKLPRIKVADWADRATQPIGWADAMQPYLKSTQIFQCPSESGSSVSATTGGGYTDYWMNSLAAGKSDASFDAPTQTVLLGDGGFATAGDASDDDSSSADWSGTARYPSAGGADLSACTGVAVKATIPDGGATRHLDGTNYAFADGHAKWLKGVGGTLAATKNLSAAVYDGCSGTNNGPTFGINESNTPAS